MYGARQPPVVTSSRLSDLSGLPGLSGVGWAVGTAVGLGWGRAPGALAFSLGAFSGFAAAGGRGFGPAAACFFA
jgi:hypothetical protein